jgi:CysZ protein
VSERKARLSVRDGVKAFFGGVGFVVATPGVWGYAMVPVLVALVLGSGLSALGIWGGFEAADAIVDSRSGWGTAARVTLIVLFSVMAVLFAFLVAFSLAQPISGFALEAIVKRQEKALGSDRAWPDHPFFQNLGRSLLVNLTSLAIGVPILVLLTVIEIAAAPAAVVTIPLKFAVSALMVSWDFLDYPLGLRGAGAGQRVRFVVKNFGAVLAFGLLGAVLLLVPGFGLLLLPMGAAGATRMVLEDEMLTSSRSARSPRSELSAAGAPRTP